MGAARLAVIARASLAVAFAAPARDGATIVNSGSTNVAGWNIQVWSDGTARSPAKAFAVPAALTAAFFTDLRAGRASGAQGGRCMKSASFGSTTRATWHDWTSPDLSCPGDDPSLAALARDVDAIHQASGLTQVHRGGFGPGGGVPIPIPT